MLCCLGLFAGYAIGSIVGGPWGFIGAAIGFGLGFLGDTKLMRGHGSHGGGCCGGGHVHDRTREQCLLCGMQVDKKTTRYKTIHKGSIYYFCSENCKTAFDENSQRYL